MKYGKLLILIFFAAIFLIAACSLMPNYEYYEMTLMSNFLDENGNEEIIKVSGTTEHTSLWWSEEDYRSTFIRKGYFIGSWNTNRDGSGRKIYYQDDNMQFREKNDGLVLYAQWEMPDKFEMPACSVFVIGDKNVRIAVGQKSFSGATSAKFFRSTTNQENSFELIGVSDSFVFYDKDFTDIPTTYYYKTQIINDLNDAKSELSKSVPILEKIGMGVNYNHSLSDANIRIYEYTPGYYNNNIKTDICVYKSVDSLSGYSKISCISSEDFYDKDLELGTKYYYKVAAEVYSFKSEFSDVASVQTKCSGPQNVKIDNYILDEDSISITISWTPFADKDIAYKVVRVYDYYYVYQSSVLDGIIASDTVENYYGSSATIKYGRDAFSDNRIPTTAFRFKVGSAISEYTEAEIYGGLDRDAEVKNLRFEITGGKNNNGEDSAVISWDYLDNATHYSIYMAYDIRLNNIVTGNDRDFIKVNSWKTSVNREHTYEYYYILVVPFDSVSGSTGKMSVFRERDFRDN